MAKNHLPKQETQEKWVCKELDVTEHTRALSALPLSVFQGMQFIREFVDRCVFILDLRIFHHTTLQLISFEFFSLGSNFILSNFQNDLGTQKHSIFYATQVD